MLLLLVLTAILAVFPSYAGLLYPEMNFWKLLGPGQIYVDDELTSLVMMTRLQIIATNTD